MSILINSLLNLFDFCFYIKGKFVKKAGIMIIPHSSMCSVDHYDIINYKSDSALTFLNYLLSNELQKDKIIFVAISDNSNIEKYKSYVADRFPGRKVAFVLTFMTRKYTIMQKFRIRARYNDSVISSSHIFTSITHNLSSLVNGDQIICDLNYYTTSLKNDIFEPGDPSYLDYRNVGKEYTYFFQTSELSIRLALAEYNNTSYKKYKYLGLCRNDSLLDGEKCNWLREEVSLKVSYPVKTIALYIPTHRDYESKSKSFTRSALGFEYDKKNMDLFLRENGIVIYCKLHPKQNALVVNTELPEGIILHQPSEKFGLAELMQASDALITDYTSGYFDYLLLDKPVIFNLYDLDLYIKHRGIPFMPIDSVAAGDIIANEDELKTALLSLEKNQEAYREKRTVIRDLFFTYPDGKSCKRIYNFIFTR